MSAVIPPQPTTEQVVVAITASLLPLAGPFGIAAAALIPAFQQLLDTFRNAGTKNYTIEELAAIVGGGTAHLATLKSHVDALPR